MIYDHKFDVCNLPAGVFLYLPSSTAPSCPRRVYPMSGHSAEWKPLVHKYLRGMQRQKQDGVAFHEFQVRGSYRPNLNYCS